MLWDEWWRERGEPWDHDPGPARGDGWAELFAATPNYRVESKRVLGRDIFRWPHGPMFYRGRLNPGGAKVLVIGQEGAQDEALAHRSFIGGTGSRMQDLLAFLGITSSYLFLNTFVYSIVGEYHDGLRPLAQDHDAALVQHRHRVLEHAVATNDVALVVSVGRAAKETVATWKAMRGGSLPAGAQSVHVIHPGAITSGMGPEIRASFAAAAKEVLGWARRDPQWLPVDDGAERASGEFVLGSRPVPFADLPFGITWRMGRGSTSSNRRDRGRSIQIFSADGRHNESAVDYEGPAAGSRDGYRDDEGDLPWEPPKVRFDEYDRGPGAHARLLMGGQPGLGWPDFGALGLPAHPSFGYGPVLRGRPQAQVVVLADQVGHDDLFTGRALSGEAGQRLHRFLGLAGVDDDDYAVVRPLPVDGQGASPATLRRAIDDGATMALVRAILALASRQVVVALGPLAQRLAPRVVADGVPVVGLAVPGQRGWKATWESGVDAVAGHLGRPRSAGDPTERDQIPRGHLPFGTLRWQGTSGDRALRGRRGESVTDYYKLVMPDWVASVQP